jgi:hypothetical protein
MGIKNQKKNLSRSRKIYLSQEKASKVKKNSREVKTNMLCSRKSYQNQENLTKIQCKNQEIRKLSKQIPLPYGTEEKHGRQLEKTEVTRVP